MKSIDGEWFKERLREIRKSQAGLSRHIGANTATVNHMLHGRRTMLLPEVEDIARYLEVTPAEILMRVGLPIVAIPENTQAIPLAEDSDGELKASGSNGWIIPKDFISNNLNATPEGLVITEVKDDCMSPTMRVGDRVLIDTSHTKPTPAGVFAINDGFGVSLKRIAHLLHSNPPELRVTSDSSDEDAATVPASDLKILGRAVCVLNRL